MLSYLSSFASTCWALLTCKPEELDDNDELVWCRDIESHSCGEFSFAVAQANDEIEDHSQVEVGSNAIFVGIYDGHGGAETAKFTNNNLFLHLTNIASRQRTITEDTLRGAVEATEKAFLNIVRSTQDLKPEMKCVGSCCLIGVIFKRTLLLANVGDSRAVMGSLVPELNRVVARQLTTDHNASDASVRRELVASNPDDPNIVVHVNNAWRVKGILQITRSIGDAYLKNPEFVIDHPSIQEYRLPQPLIGPALTARPSMLTRDLTTVDKFIIFASDGLWDNLTNQEAVDIVNKYPPRGIARRLVKASQKVAAMKRNMSYKDLQKIPKKERRDYQDDITVVVVFIKHEALGYKVPSMSRSFKGLNNVVNESQFAHIDNLM